MIAYSEQQLRAISNRANRLVIQASAGAGKTRVIVGRFLDEVMVHGRSVEQVLTTTFTNKAASEMKLRITTAFRDAGLHKEAHEVQSGPIQTLHSFCERVLRANACEVPIDPDFSVLPISDKKEWVRIALGQAIEASTGEQREFENFFESLAGVREDESDSPHSRLETWASKCLDEFRGSTVRLEELAHISSSPEMYSRHWKAQFCMWVEQQTSVTCDFEASEFWASLRRTLKDAGKRIFSYSEATAHLMDAQWEAFCERSTQLIRITALTWRLLEDRMRAEAKLDFTLLESACLDLLRTQPEVAERLRRQYPVVLVDESQDLNPIQYAILDYLRPESLTLVGDPAQSIYSFRQAAPRLFQEFADSAAVERLTCNYRSDPGLIQTLDSVFSKRWTHHVPMESGRAEGTEKNPVEIWDLATKDWRAIALQVQSLGERFDWNDIAILVRRGWVGSEIAARIRELGIAARLEGISETFYSSLEVSDLANTLEALCDPTDRFAVCCMMRSPVVGLSLSTTLRYASQETCELSEEPPEWVLENDRETWQRWMAWFGKLSSSSASLPAWELLSAILAQSSYYVESAKLSTRWQTLANVRKLLQLASTEVGLGGAEFAAKIRTIQRLKHKEGVAEAVEPGTPMVRIMTIHAAKGLEFPCVVLPDAFGAVVVRANTLELERERGLVVPVLEDVEKEYRTAMLALQRRKVIEEFERVLYVAMTRAEEKLCVVASPDISASQSGYFMWELLNQPELSHLPRVRLGEASPSFDPL